MSARACGFRKRRLLGHSCAQARRRCSDSIIWLVGVPGEQPTQMLAIHLSLELDTERLSLGTPLVFHRMLDKIRIVDQDALQQNGGLGPALRDSLSQCPLWQRAVPLLAIAFPWQLLAIWRTQLAGVIGGRSISTRGYVAANAIIAKYHAHTHVRLEQAFGRCLVTLPYTGLIKCMHI